MTRSTLRLKSILVLSVTMLSLMATAQGARPQDKPEPPRIIRKSGGVLQGSAIKRVEPMYPPLAKTAEISGAVVVEVTVDEDGSVIAARAISGHPLLKDAAVTAARGWVFAPTILAGAPVKVIGTITFNFNLGTPPAQTGGDDDQSDNVPRGVPGGIPGGVPGGVPGHGAGPGQPVAAKGENRLLALLDQSRYSYVKVSDGVWEVPATGKNLPTFNIRITRANDVVLLIAKLADRKNVTARMELLVKLLEMNHRYDYAKVALTDEMLYVRMDIRARVLDGPELSYAIEQVAKVVDGIYPEVKAFIAANAEPSSRPPGMPGPGTQMIVDPGIPRPEPARPPAGNGNDDRADTNSLNSSPVDSRPVALNNAAPRYTEEARRHKVMGRINLLVLVGEDGMVKQVRVVQGLPDGLDEQAIRAALQLRFKPAMRKGQPVSYWVPMSFDFSLR